MIRRRVFGLTAVLAALLVASTAPASPSQAIEPSGAINASDEFADIGKPSLKLGSWSARLVAPARATSLPGAGRTVTRLKTSTSWSRSPQSLLVLDTHESEDGRQWLKVLLPIRPTGSSGWISRNRVVTRRSDLWIEVRKRNRRLVVFKDGRKIRRYRVVIGNPATPTPTGLAAIYERNRQPNPNEFLGPWALPITSLSATIKNYGGGPGRIAIHGRGGESYKNPLGSARSHGCIRVTNRGIRWLARYARPGTPVLVRNE